ncbi:MAG: hydrolase 1, exosortase A system-associated [Gammaproteobacteria bacterium]|nr:hydrolase 1, exosortase A system-associated [Gammaproteobacteria bacterium]
MIVGVKEIPFVFDCRGESLVGILHQPRDVARIGVLIVVGGPQYRVGSHRQFLLLARALSAQGFPVLRFDYRAMGDAEGDGVDFADVDTDIAAAIDQFYKRMPEMQGVVIWGLCDAASAAIFYAYKDSRVKRLVLLNPWVRTESGEAKAYLKHYYLARLCSGAFWKKLFSGQWKVWESARSFLGMLKKSKISNSSLSSRDEVLNSDAPLPERMAEGLRRFNGEVLFVLSGKNDYVACEFRDMVAVSADWQALLSRDGVQLKTLPEANHTFSSAQWRDQVGLWTLTWLDDLSTK